jgi:hypothetical protein
MTLTPPVESYLGCTLFRTDLVALLTNRSFKAKGCTPHILKSQLDDTNNSKIQVITGVRIKSRCSQDNFKIQDLICKNMAFDIVLLITDEL